jgi:hypothetical protein
MRTSTLRGFVAPTGVMVEVCRKRSSFVCRLRSISQISSRNSVPPSAAAAAPGLSEIAPVNEPRRWPKTSDSSRSTGIAPQLSAMKGPRARADSRCTASAASSLPVPLSPVMKTVAIDRATERILS